MGRLEGKIAIITGGGTGIGRASALLFAREGASVVIANRSVERGDSVAHEIQAEGGSGLFVRTDVTEPDQVAHLFEQTQSFFGPPNVLLNVVGISGRRFGDGPVHECTEEGWDHVMKTNLRSMFLMCRAAIPAMQAVGGGSIVNMGSVLATSPAPTFFATHAYAASKGAILSLSQAMASHYARDRIRVNVLAPALIATPMSERAQDNPEIIEYIRTKQPLTESLGTPQDCAQAALYLASDESAFVTGIVLPVDGGWQVSEGQVQRYQDGLG